MWTTSFDPCMFDMHKEVGIKCSDLNAVEELAVIISNRFGKDPDKVREDFIKWRGYYGDETVLYITYDGVLTYSDEDWARSTMERHDEEIFWCSFDGTVAKIIEVEDLL